MYEGEIFLIIKMLEVLQFVHQTIIGRQKRSLKIKNRRILFFVFSDDINWCKKKLGFNGDNVIFVSQDMPVYETLRLMYNCKHFILSNSTFSWWGQFLSTSKNKLVVSPSRWNNDGYQSQLIQKDWILINC